MCDPRFQGSALHSFDVVGGGMDGMSSRGRLFHPVLPSGSAAWPLPSPRPVSDGGGGKGEACPHRW